MFVVSLSLILFARSAVCYRNTACKIVLWALQIPLQTLLCFCLCSAMVAKGRRHQRVHDAPQKQYKHHGIRARERFKAIGDLCRRIHLPSLSNKRACENHSGNHWPSGKPEWKPSAKHMETVKTLEGK